MLGEAYVTLASRPGYCWGALVLGQSLRQVGTSRELVVMVTPGVGVELRNCLRQVFDHVLEVPEWRSHQLETLSQMGRPELAISLTKLHCWTLTQYRKAVFMDSDTMVLQNIDDLFEREELSAAPDPGWPDCFNSGVFVFSPSMATYHSLQDFVSTNGSFDGGDQGLLNFFFTNWGSKDFSRRLPFVYNLSWGSIYSHEAAFERFRPSVRVLHFLGAAKPWHFHCPDGGLLAWVGDEETFGVKGQSAWCTTPAESPMPVGAQEGCLRDWWHLFRSKVQPLLASAGIDRLPTESKQAGFITNYPSAQFPHLVTSYSATRCCLPDSVAFYPPSCTPYVFPPYTSHMLTFSLPARVSPIHFISPSPLDHLDSKAAGPSASTFTNRASAREGKQKAKDSLCGEKDKSNIVRFAGGIKDLPFWKGQDEDLLLQKDQDEDLLLQKDQGEDLLLQKDQDEDLLLQKDQDEDLLLQQDQDEDPLLQKDQDEDLLLQKDQDEDPLLQKDQDEDLLLQKDQDEDLVLQKDQDEDLVLQKDQDEDLLLQKDQDEDLLLQKEQDEDLLLQKDQDEDLLLQKDQDEALLLQQDQDEDLLLQKDQDQDEDPPLWKEQGQDEDLALLKDRDQDENLALLKDRGQDEDLVLPIDRGQDEDLPLPKDRSQDEDLPLPKDQSQDEDLPLPKDRSQDEDLPLPKDRSQDEDLPLPKDRSQDEDLPLPKDRSQDEDLPLPKDRSQDEDLPLPKDRSQDEDLPLPKDRSQDEDLPLPKDRSQDEDLPLPKDRSQDEDLPLPKDRSQDEDLPLPKDRSQDEDLPLPKDRSQDEDLPLLKDRSQDEDLPLPKDRSQDEDLPLLKDRSQDEDLPLPKDRSQDEDLPLPKDKDKDNGMNEDLPLWKYQDDDQHDVLLLQKAKELPVENVEKEEFVEKEETFDGHEEARRKNWEEGIIDYLGEDSFENIQRHLDEML
uniref:trichohyalin-like isoform X1 n=1 Tax=Myxine glutinosa TaxID=7769 RepID=UPI00358EE398